jgi:glycosyltransferase involved in cell wall biosynthesis
MADHAAGAQDQQAHAASVGADTISLVNSRSILYRVRMNRLPARMLVVAASLPPESTGGAVVLGRMMRGFDPRDYRLASFDPPMAPAPGKTLPARTFRVSRPWRADLALEPLNVLARSRGLRRTCVEAARRARDMLRIIRAESCAAVLVATGAAPDLLAGAIAAQYAALPLVVWMYDHWRLQNQHLLGYAVSGALLERAIVARAQAVIVSTERLRDDLWREHGVEATVIPHLLDPDVPPGDVPPEPWPADPRAPTIAYTGQVYAAQLDAVARLVDALESPPLDEWRLHIHGSVAPPADFVRQARVVSHPASDAAAIRAIQRKADILFIPLAFASPYPTLINAALPTKTVEYLDSGRPILVHAPPGSYLADFTRRTGFAELVDQPAPELIATAIQRLAGDAALRQELVERARALLPRFSPQRGWEQMLTVLNGALERA